MLLDPPRSATTMDSEASAMDALRQAAERTAASLKEGFNQRLARL